MISIPSACDTVADMAWFDFSIVDTPPEIPFSEYVLAINNFFKIFKVDMSRKIIVIMNPSFYNRNVGLSRIWANEKKRNIKQNKTIKRSGKFFLESFDAKSVIIW